MKKPTIKLTDDEDIQIGRQFGLNLRWNVSKRFKTERAFFYATGFPERLYFKLISGSNPTLKTIFLLSICLAVHPKELLDFDLSKKVMSKKEFSEKYRNHGLPIGEKEI